MPGTNMSAYPEVNLLTFFLNFNVSSFTLVNCVSVDDLKTTSSCFDWLMGGFFWPGSLKKPYYLMLRNFLTLLIMSKQLMSSVFLAEIDWFNKYVALAFLIFSAKSSPSINFADEWSWSQMLQ